MSSSSGEMHSKVILKMYGSARWSQRVGEREMCRGDAPEKAALSLRMVMFCKLRAGVSKRGGTLHARDDTH
jgi:hypothetical protein